MSLKLITIKECLYDMEYKELSNIKEYIDKLLNIQREIADQEFIANVRKYFGEWYDCPEKEWEIIGDKNTIIIKWPATGNMLVIDKECMKIYMDTQTIGPPVIAALWEPKGAKKYINTCKLMNGKPYKYEIKGEITVYRDIYAHWYPFAFAIHQRLFRNLKEITESYTNI